MLLNLISLSLAVKIINAAGTYTSKGCYSFSALESYLTSKGEYTYQTNSYCEKQCSGYAVAATLDGSTCYCGNDLPSSISSVSSSNCDVTCQGFPTEICGGDGYLSVYTNGDEDTGSSSSSTTGGTTTTLSTSASQAETTTTPATSQTTSQTTSAATTTEAATTTTTDGTSTTATQTTGTSSTTSASTSIQVITSVISGSESVITATQTVAPTSSSTSGSNNSNTTSSASSSSASPSSSSSSSSSSDGLSKGAIAGIAVGSVIGVFGIIGLIIGCFCYLRHQNDDDDDDNALDESGSSIANKFNSDKPIHNDFQFYGSQMNSNTNNQFQNPNAPFFSFDEINGHKRLSNGSLPDARHEKTLRVVNPDDELHNGPRLRHEDLGQMSDDSDDSEWRK